MSKICKNCGALQDESAKFCEECGSSLAQIVSVEPEVSYEPVHAEAEPERVEVVIEPPRRYDSPAADAREVRERLIGTKTEFYLPKFETMETLNSFTSWNWASFIFGTAWMVYRKMYVFGAVLWLVSQVIGALGLWPLSLVMWVAYGVLGNYLYMKDIDNRTEKAMNMTPEQREAYIQKNSGTSWIGVIVLYLLSAAVQAL